MHEVLFWYSNIFLFILLLAIIGKIFQKISGAYKDVPFGMQIEEVITIPFHLVAFLAVYAFLYEEQVLTQFFWQLYVSLSLFLQIVSFWLPKQRWLKEQLPKKVYLSANAAAIFSLCPLYYMITSYAFISFPAGL